MINKFSTIEITFEGYSFNVMVEYINFLCFILIKDRALITINTRLNVNKQDFYHIRNVFDYSLKLGEYDKTIKNKLRKYVL